MGERILYELAGAANERRFSPYCWRARLALHHKRLTFDTIAWRVTEKDQIAFSKQDKVPVLVDEDQVISDSWAIAQYLEQTYPEYPTLFGGIASQALAHFVTRWVDLSLMPSIFPMIVADIHDHLHPKDQNYFRQGRERMLGETLETVAADRDQRLPSFRQELDPLRVTLQEQPFLSGEHPLWPDYAVFSAFQWSRCISPFPLIEASDSVYQWRERMLDLFDGMARDCLGYSY